MNEQELIEHLKDKSQVQEFSLSSPEYDWFPVKVNKHGKCVVDFDPFENHYLLYDIMIRSEFRGFYEDKIGRIIAEYVPEYLAKGAKVHARMIRP